MKRRDLIGRMLGAVVLLPFVAADPSGESKEEACGTCDGHGVIPIQMRAVQVASFYGDPSSMHPEIVEAPCPECHTHREVAQ